MSSQDSEVNSNTIDRQQHWSSVYKAKASTQMSWYQANPARSLSMIRAAGIALDARIIDVGGGASTLPDHLLAAGYSSITVLDISSDALDQSRLRLGPAARGITWLTCDVLAWEPPTRYALWHDRAVFHFLTDPSDRSAYLSVMRNALQPGGTVVLATFALDGPERCSGLVVQRYSPATLAAELGRDFRLVETATEHHATPSGTIQKFTYCRFTRSPA